MFCLMGTTFVGQRLKPSAGIRRGSTSICVANFLQCTLIKYKSYIVSFNKYNFLCALIISHVEMFLLCLSCDPQVFSMVAISPGPVDWGIIHTHQQLKGIQLQSHKNYKVNFVDFCKNHGPLR